MYKLAGLAPFTQGTAVTPNDVTVFAPTRGLYVGGAGNINVLFKDSTTPVVLTGVPVGTTLDICIEKVLSTSTTATNLIALY